VPARQRPNAGDNGLGHGYDRHRKGSGEHKEAVFVGALGVIGRSITLLNS
jgi:hypothetical protein